jgi:YidC/Oxa1 family membrane protein insertase
MFDLIATVLAWFYSFTHSYGVAIVLLTLAIMVALTPLTLKGTRSMMVMQALQPEMRKIQQRYKDDRQKLNEELHNKINPLGGCLPLLLQAPVFLVLYRVLRGLTNPLKFGVVLQALNAGLPGFNPSYIGADTELHKALSGQHEMVSFGMDLSRSATQAIRESFGHSVPYLLLIIGVAATSYYQQKQVQGRNPNAAQVNPQQQMLMKILPLFFAFISINLPAALVVYFFVSNLYRVGQQAFISHRIYKPAVASGLFEAQAKEKDAKDGKDAKDEPAPKPAKREATSTASTEARPAGGFFGRLLGDAAPRLGSASKDNGAKGAAAPTGGKPNGQRGSTPARPPAARSGTGRTTPSGGPQPRARKKKKRK